MYFSILSFTVARIRYFGGKTIRTVKEDSCAIACSHGGKNKTKKTTITDQSSLKYQDIL